MNCDRAESLFSDCWDDESSVAERDALRAHFDACARCRAEYEAFARTMQAVHALPRFTAEADFTDRVVARAKTAQAERRPAPRVFVFPQVAWRWERGLAAAAALAIVAAGTWYAIRPNALTTTEPTQVATRTVQVPQSPAEEASPLPASVPQADARAGSTPPASDVREMRTETAGTSVSDEHVAVAKPTRNEQRDLTASAAPEAAAIPDSLFDHSYDVEFAFEPVNLRRVAGDAKVAPARPAPSSEVGRRAKITF